jgi:hypothetical protein
MHVLPANPGVYGGSDRRSLVSQGEVLVVGRFERVGQAAALLCRGQGLHLGQQGFTLPDIGPLGVVASHHLLQFALTPCDGSPLETACLRLGVHKVLRDVDGVRWVTDFNCACVPKCVALPRAITAQAETSIRI